MEGNAQVKPPKINISSDGLDARIFFPMPEPGQERETYTKGQILDMLKDAGVTFGIDQEAVARIADSPMYNRDVVIATGKNAVQGEPGHYDYYFDLTVNRKPTIREDGSTDYMNIKVIETVDKDQVIAVYHPAVQGAKGITVRGQMIEPKPVRDLPPLAGRGFDREDDGVTYRANIDGKIEMSGNRILILPVYEISGDVNISTGNVDFNGDVIVHGGVSDGAIIRAAGSVTIDGLVESCEIYTRKDLFLLSGVKGGDKTIIDAQGNITAQFMEYAFVNCKGDITADYVFNSRVTCDGHIELNGNKAAIIGGYTAAVRGIDVNEIGNSFGTITNVVAGIAQEKLVAIEQLNQEVTALSDNIAKIKKALNEFEKLAEARGANYKDDPRRLQLLRVKIRDEAVLLEQQSKLQDLKNTVEHGTNATIKVFKRVYAGTSVSIDSHHVNVKENQDRVEFVKTPTGIRMDYIESLIRN